MNGGEKFTGNKKQRKTFERLIELQKKGQPIPAKGVIGNLIYQDLKDNPHIKNIGEDAGAFRTRWVNMKIESMKRETLCR